MTNKHVIYIALAFLVGAVFPLLGLLAAVFIAGNYYAASTKGEPTKCDPQLMRDIKEMERIEHNKQRQRR